MIDAVADINAQNAVGKTPLHVAAKPGTVAKIEALLSLGADGTIQDNDGNTPFDLFKAIERLSDSPVFLALQSAADNIRQSN